MATASSEILIIGGGVAGLATAFHLAAQGFCDVVVLEREPHLASQSSALNAAILRTLCADPLETRLGLASARFLRDPPAGFSDVPLVDRRGLILAAGARADELRSWAKAVEGEHGGVALSGEALAARVPGLGVAVEHALFFPDEGQIDIAALVAGFARGARRSGIELRRSAGVRRLHCEAGAVRGVELSNGERLVADRVVVAAGGWAGELGRAAGSRVALRPTRRHLLITAPSNEVDPRGPVFWWLEDGEFYCRPDSGGLLLCACDLIDVEPERCARDPEIRTRIAEKTARILPQLASAGAASFWCGMRTLTSDGHFAIGPDPDLPGLFWVAGLAGSGMVCSAEVGRLAATMLLGGEVAPEIARTFDPARLAE